MPNTSRSQSGSSNTSLRNTAAVSSLTMTSSTSPATLNRRRRRSYKVSAQLLVTSSSSQTVHHHRIGAAPRPTRWRWSSARGSACGPVGVDTATQTPTDHQRRRRCPPGQYRPNAAQGAGRNPKRPPASRESDPDQRPTRRPHCTGAPPRRSGVPLTGGFAYDHDS